jgi:hypothetical protein
MNAEFIVFVGTIEPSHSGKTGTVSIRQGGQRETLEAAIKKARSLDIDGHFVWVEKKGDIAMGKVAHVADGSRVKNLP